MDKGATGSSEIKGSAAGTSPKESSGPSKSSRRRNRRHRHGKQDKQQNTDNHEGTKPPPPPPEVGKEQAVACSATNRLNSESQNCVGDHIDEKSPKQAVVEEKSNVVCENDKNEKKSKGKEKEKNENEGQKRDIESQKKESEGQKRENEDQKKENEGQKKVNEMKEKSTNEKNQPQSIQSAVNGQQPNELLGATAAVPKPDGQLQQKSKSQLRAERRELQEAQRAAKAERMAKGGAKKPQDVKASQDKAKGPQKVPEVSKDKQASNERNIRTAQKDAATSRGDRLDSAKSKPERGAKVGDSGNRNKTGYHAEEVVRVSEELRQDDPQQVKKKLKRLEKQNLSQRAETHKKVDLFLHLPQCDTAQGVLPLEWKAGNNPVHAAFNRIGVQMAYKSLIGANNRCIALAEALSTFIDSYERAEDKEFGRHFESVLSPNITFLSQCRPLTAGMRTFIRVFKSNVSKFGRDESLTDENRKELLQEMIANFINEKIVMASENIANHALKRIRDDDVILTYAYSSTVGTVLKHAWTKNRRFTVIVADSEPLHEGRRMIKFLEKENIPCEYVALFGIPSIMKRVTRVFLGAQALFNNGSVLSRVGTGFVANLAHDFGCHVHVCCESYKFWERTQLDSFVYNELGDPGDLITSSKMRTEWENPDSGLHYLNPVYDVTPSELVDSVITELSIITGASVPVVLRRNTTNE